MLRTPLLLAVAAVLVAALIWLVAGAERAGDARTSPAPGAEAERVDSGAGESGSLAEPRSVAGEGGPNDRELDPATSRRAQAAPGGALRVTGRIVVVDEDGSEHAEEDGSFAPVRWDGASGEVGAPVRVRAGRFELRVEAGLRLGFASVVLGNRRVQLDDVGPFRPTPGTDLELRGRWASMRALVVLDEAHRQDLTEITVVAALGEVSPRGDDPGDYPPQTVLAEDARSPILLTDLPFEERGIEGDVTLWVGARGYRWEQVKVPARGVEDLVVLLRPGCDLEVHLSGRPQHWPRARHPRVLVRDAPEAGEGTEIPDLEELVEVMEQLPLDQFPEGRRPTREELEAFIEDLRAKAEDALPDGPVLAEREAGDEDPVRFRGLAPGMRRVSVEIGRSWEEGRIVLGQGDVYLPPGSSVSTTIAVAEPPPLPEPVPLAGTLEIPDAWELSHFTLELRPLSLPGAGEADVVRLDSPEMTAVEGTRTTYRWEVPDVIPGEYAAKLESVMRSRRKPGGGLEIRFRGELEEVRLPDPVVVPVGGRGDVRLRLPEPADVRLKVVEEGSGRSVDEAVVTWNPPVEPPQSTVRVGQALRGEDGLFEFRARPGELWIRASSPEHVALRRRVEVLPGTNSLRFELQRAAGVEVRFLDGERAVTLDSPLSHLGLRLRGGPDGERRFGASGSHGRYRILVPEPGTYELELPELEGYLPVPARTVEVPAQTIVPVEIRLVPGS